MSADRRRWPTGLALALVAVATASAVTAPARAWAAVAVLAILATGAEAVAARLPNRLAVSAAVVAAVVAGAESGPLGAAVVPAVSFTATWVLDRYRVEALLINLAGSIAPSVALAHVLQASSLDPSSWGYLGLVTGGTFAVMVAATAIVASLMALLDARPLAVTAGAFRPLVVAGLLTAGGAGLTVALYVRAGWWALAFLGLELVMAAYAVRLVARADDNARRHVALSWGVLSGLLRAMDRRDRRSARHAAAVAAFSRDLGHALGLPPRTVAIAHTAGLLHDLGHFALPDRVLDRDVVLQPADWEGIREHPAIAADLLRDIGVYGPLAEIIRAHHERIDGRGYPDGRAGEDIPLAARIVAVAEAYDAMTAPDTYRAQLTSFEAITELRRCAGTQFDPRCVEAFASLLGGRDTTYRHAAGADLDVEIALERRLAEAAGSA